MNAFTALLAGPLKKEIPLRQAPPVPDTGWLPPRNFPDLRGAQVIAFDTETKEEDFDYGPGWARGTGHIIGVSIAAILADNRCQKWYFPVRHEVERDQNCDPTQLFAWLHDTLGNTPHIPKVGANLIYDCGWLSTENVYPAGPLYDVQFAEALIDEQGLTALDFLGRKYVSEGKSADACKDWIQRAFGTKGDFRSHLWRAPPRLVGPYAEGDAELPLRVLPRQWEVMQSEETLDLFKMECRAIPMLVKMRQSGISVDLARAEQLREQVDQETTELYSALRHATATTVDNVSAPSQLSKVFDAIDLKYPRTATGKPSFKKEWLTSLEHPVGKMVNDIREREKLRDTFIDSYILDRARRFSGDNRRGRVYCSFHPLRDDAGGTKTGRYSSSDPNLQNIPVRTKLGKQIREIFIPDEGHETWHKKDHSQIEYRVFAHYAVGARSDEIRQRYCDDPATDYHDDTMRDVALLRSIDLAAMSKAELASFRKPIKNVNFGLLYGQTEPSLAYKAGWTQEQAKEFFGGYHAARPFVRTTMQAIESEVQAYGYVTTILKRRTRFNRWEALHYRDRTGAFDHKTATLEHGSKIRRAFAYRAVNYRFQGSAADILKAGMLSCYEQGVFDYIGMPKLQVHDELDWSKINNSPAMDEAFKYAAHVMETAIKLRVPLKVDSGEGATWGNVE